MFTFLAENRRIISRFIVTFFFVGIAAWFIQHEQPELIQVKELLIRADSVWLLTGFLITCLYILMCGWMYLSAFAAVGSKVQISDTVILFLKRNLVSIFLPAGGVSSLAFFSSVIEKKGINKSQINFASSVYGFVGILSVTMLAVPAFAFALFRGSLGSADWLALAAVVLLLGFLYYAYRSIQKRGWVYVFLSRRVPFLKVILEEISANRIVKRWFIQTILCSLLIDMLGISHLYVAIRALHLPASLFVAVMGYLTAVIFIIVSPFLRGLGAVELSMTYMLSRFGFSTLEAISVTFLYRFFEFWLPLLAGLLSFLLAVNNLLMRIFPALLLMALGIINLVSVLTPALSSRLSRLEDVLPLNVIHASNYLVFIAGLFLLITAAFMLKGSRMAWYFAVTLCLLSAIGHITKAIDYEEALASFGVLIILWVSRKEYYVKHNPRMRDFGLQTTFMLMLAIIIYGIVGFYFLDVRHFKINFTVLQSIRYTLENFFLLRSSSLMPLDRFARVFVLSINLSGFFSITFLIFTLVRPLVFKSRTDMQSLEKARALLDKYGASSLDYFKIYGDKAIFFPEGGEAFLAYRVRGTFAVVLENPVAANAEEMKKCIASFERYCEENGLKTLFYRVPEESLELFQDLGKKPLFLGQEGVVDLSAFTLQGGERKSLRNGIKKVAEKGYKCCVYSAPVKDGILQKIKLVSDEWLRDTGRNEIGFSQGMFDWEKLKQQVILTVENQEEKVVAFLNIIPDYKKDECTFDLIRKTADAPPGTMDFLMVELFNYLKTRGCRYVNLGLAPLTGLEDPHSLTERSLKFASEKIKSFSHYRGLRDFKEKFSPCWHNQYLIYEQDYDLFQVPRVLAGVIKT